MPEAPDGGFTSKLINNLEALGKFLEESGTVEQLKEMYPSRPPNASDEMWDAVMWMVWLYCNGIGGLLEDEAGGFPNIVSAAIQSLNSQGVFASHLVIVDDVGPWRVALQAWAPDVVVKVLQGTPEVRREVRHWFGTSHNQAASLRDRMERSGVLLTTYQSLITEPSLATFPWDFVVSSDGVPTSSYKSISTITTTRKSHTDLLIRVGLLVTGKQVPPTGIPMIPSDTLPALIKAVSPFRRLLAPTVPVVRSYLCIPCPLSELQYQLYQQCKANQASPQVKLMQLRKVCCHPYLFDEHMPDQLRSGCASMAEDEGRTQMSKMLGASGKLHTLYRLLSILRGSKVLVCSCISRVLDLIGVFLSLSNTYCNAGFDFSRVDGSANPPSPIHLSSSKGVYPLNGYDYIISYDVDLNVGADVLLIGRASKGTKFIRLVAPKSVDEAILAVTSHTLEKESVSVSWGGEGQLLSVGAGDVVAAINAAAMKYEASVGEPHTETQLQELLKR